MDKMRSRKPTFKSQPSDTLKATHEDFKPEFEWTEDPSNRILAVQMPGFKREEIRVQMDSAGKLLVKGRKKVSDNKYRDIDQSFDVPKDTLVEKIIGRFDDGRLTLIMPKRAVEEPQPATQKAVTEEKEKEPAQEERKEKPKRAVEEPQPATQKAVTEEKEKEPAHEERKEKPVPDEKKEEPVPDEQSKAIKEKTDKEPPKKAEKTDEEKIDEPVREKPVSHEEKDEPLSKKESTTGKEKQNELAQTEQPKNTKDYKDGLIQEDKKDERHVHEQKPGQQEEKQHPISEGKMETGEEKRDELAEEDEQGSTKEKKEDHCAKEMGKEDSIIQKMKSKISEVCANKTKEITKRIYKWRGTEESWLDSGSLDSIRDKLNRNKKEIAVAIVAFSAGFYVSNKLREDR